MTNITASISKEFFGEPVYIGEMAKDLVAAALGLERSDLRFTHQPNTDESPEASIVFTIDSVGDEDTGTKISDAMVAAMQPARLTFAVHFTETAPEGMTFDTRSELDEAVSGVKSGASRMTSAHVAREDERAYEQVGEILEEQIHTLGKILKKY